MEHKTPLIQTASNSMMFRIKTGNLAIFGNTVLIISK